MITFYRITNTVNGKVYIGQTNNFKHRIYSHKCAAKKVKYPLHKAIAKYGFDRFLFEEIAACWLIECADEIETNLIKQYDSRNPEKGYNLHIGGNTSRGWHHTEEARRKISIMLKGKYKGIFKANSGSFKKGQVGWNKGTKGIMKPNKTSFKPGHVSSCGFKKGLVPWMKGKKHSEESKAKMSASLKGQLPPNRVHLTEEDLNFIKQSTLGKRKIAAMYKICAKRVSKIRKGLST